MIRLAIIGLGHITDYQLEALSNIDNGFRLVLACDRNRSLLDGDQFKNVTKIEEYENVADHKDEIDCILISLPNKLHFEAAKFFLARGFDVILEKPAVLDFPELIELYAIADQNGADLHIAFHARFASDLLFFENEFKNIQKRYKLGELIGFNCNFFDPYYDPDAIGDLDARLNSLSSSWIDSGVNALSVVCSLFKDLKKVSKNESSIRFDDLGRYAQITSSVEFNIKLNNIIGRGTIHTNWTNKKNYKATSLYFDGGSGYILLDHSKQQILYLGFDGSIDLIHDSSKTGHRLVNHYTNLFMSYLKKDNNFDRNRELSLTIHALLLNG